MAPALMAPELMAPALMGLALMEVAYMARGHMALMGPAFMAPAFRSSPRCSTEPGFKKVKKPLKRVVSSVISEEKISFHYLHLCCNFKIKRYLKSDPCLLFRTRLGATNATIGAESNQDKTLALDTAKVSKDDN